jgi:sortase A
VKLLRILVAITLASGASLTARAGYLHAKAELASVLIHRAWDENIRTGNSLAPWAGADFHPVARLRIPRLGYDEIALDAATPRTLAFGPARLLSGAALGETGNLEFAGHRDTWFRSLESIAIGDTVEVQWFDSRSHRLRQRSYTVSAVDIVKPEDTSLLAQTPNDTLTLVTCYPFSLSPRSPLRYIVRATPDAPHF